MTRKSDIEKPLVPRKESHATRNKAQSFGLVCVCPLPKEVTEEEEKAFRKDFVQVDSETGQNESYKDVLLRAFVGSDAKELAAKELVCGDSLAELRNVTIELLINFFRKQGTDEHPIEVFVFTSIDDDEVFICVKQSEALAELLADIAEYHLQLNESVLDYLSIKITDRSGLIPAYVKYDNWMKEKNLLSTYPLPDGTGSAILRPVDRIRLLYDTFTDYIDKNELIRLGLILHDYPAHNAALVVPLRDKWGVLSKSLWPWQPIGEIRDYFGEKVAFYFLFLQEIMKAIFILMCAACLTSYLWWLADSEAALSASSAPNATVANMTSANVTSANVSLVSTWHLEELEAYHTSDVLKLVYATFTMFWYILFCKHWKRTESYYATLWGTDKKAEGETVSEPMTGQGDLRPSPIDENEMEPTADSRRKAIGSAISVLGQIIYMSLIVLAVILNRYKAWQMANAGNSSAYTIMAVVLSVQIQIGDLIWGFIAHSLTEWEQHVEQNDFDQSKAQKTFLMRFFNTFNTFIYIAFIQDSIDHQGCEALPGKCTGLLYTNVGMVFVTFISFGTLDMALPWLIIRYRTWCETRALKKMIEEQQKQMEVGEIGAEDVQELYQISLLEQQAKADPYLGEDATCDYLQVMFPLAFIVMFSMVRPLIVLLAFIAMGTQVRADAWKLCSAYRRVFPERVPGIGVWNRVLFLLGGVSICVNLGLIMTQVNIERIFPMIFENLQSQPNLKLVIFFALQNLMFFLSWVIDTLIDDVTPTTQRERKRQQLQKMRLLQHQDDLDELEIQLSGSPDHVSAEWYREARPVRPGDLYYELPLIT